MASALMHMDHYNGKRLTVRHPVHQSVGVNETLHEGCLGVAGGTER